MFHGIYVPVKSRNRQARGRTFFLKMLSFPTIRKKYSLSQVLVNSSDIFFIPDLTFLAYRIHFLAFNYFLLPFSICVRLPGTNINRRLHAMSILKNSLFSSKQLRIKEWERERRLRLREKEKAKLEASN